MLGRADQCARELRDFGLLSAYDYGDLPASYNITLLAHALGLEVKRFDRQPLVVCCH